jgi:ergothioneine biosynthesis protein EgtB
MPQPIEDVSPPKWHLGHVTWFYEQVFLERYVPRYKPFNPDFSWIFNSYYDSFGVRIERPLRGTLSRPTLDEVLAFRSHVDEQMVELIHSVDESNWEEFAELLVLALNHEQQHQELLLTDLKYILACNPTRPAYTRQRHVPGERQVLPDASLVSFEGGVFEIGTQHDQFCYDNEGPVHRAYLEPYQLQNRLVTNGEYLAFVEDGGYKSFDHWLSDAWTTVSQEEWRAPLYWEKRDGEWSEFTLYGLDPLDLNAPVCHVSYYEAEAFAHWSGKRLPLESEWEVAVLQSGLVPQTDGFFNAGVFHPAGLDAGSASLDPTDLHQMFGHCWEWTGSGYLPYPGYKRIDGPFGEYNGKFMVNQMVLRGGSVATSQDHIRPTYRNFFKPDKRWQFKGIRLAA